MLKFLLRGLISAALLLSVNPLRAQVDQEGDTTVPATDTAVISDDGKALDEKYEETADTSRSLDDIMGYGLDVEDNDDYSTFNILDTFLSGKSLVLTGEDHRFENFNTKLELKLAKYLHAKGYRYYLLEAGFASSWMLNKLLEGDTIIGTAQHNFYTKRFSRLFEGLRVYNQTLDSAEKFQAVGIDIERNIPLALKMLTHLLPSTPVPDSLGLFVESLQIITAIEEEKIKKARENEADTDSTEYVGNDYENDNIYTGEEEEFLFYFNLVNTVEELVFDFHRKEKEMKQYLGSDYELFSRVILELNRWLIWVNYERKEMPQSWVFREQYMENNLSRFFREKPEAKMFGQFGRCHITRITEMRDCSFAFFNSLTRRVKSSIPQLKEGILSIGIFYPDSESDAEWRDNGNVNELAQLAGENSTTIFTELDGYVSQQLSDKFDMVIMMRDDRYSNDMVNYYDDYVPDGPARGGAGNRMGYSLNFAWKDQSYSSLGTLFGRNISNGTGLFEFATFGRKNHSFCYSMNVAGLFSRQFNFADTGSMKLGGWGYKMYFGGDLARPLWLDVVPYLGFGFEQLNLSYENKSGATGLFGEAPKTEFVNPAFIIEARLEAIMNIKWFSINLFGGYMLDVSKKKWKQDSVFLTGSPNTSLNGFYAGAGIGFSYMGF